MRPSSKGRWKIGLTPEFCYNSYTLAEHNNQFGQEERQGGMFRIGRKKRSACRGIWWGLAVGLAAVCFIRWQKGEGEGEEVFITALGKKYHREDCVHLQDSRVAIPRSQAEAEGYEACGVCQP